MLRPTSPLVALCLFLAVPGACRPEKPDVLAARRVEAEQRAAAARATVASGRETMAEPGRWVRELSAEEQAQPVARVGSKVLTLGEVARRVREQPGYMQVRYALPAERAALLEQLVDFELLVAEAERLGLGETPEVVLAHKRELARRTLDRAAEARAALLIPSEDEILRHYSGHADEFTRPARDRANFIMVDGEERARRVHADLRSKVAAHPEDPEAAFREIAIHHSSHETSRMQKGDLGWLDAATAKGHEILEPALAATRLLEKRSEISAPFRIRAGTWGVVQLTGRAPASVVPLAEARVEIVQRLVAHAQEAARKTVLAELRADARIELAPSMPPAPGGKEAP